MGIDQVTTCWTSAAAVPRLDLHPNSYLDQMPIVPSGRARGAALLGVGMLLSAPVEAQTMDRPLFGIGYTANAPHLMGGGSAWTVFPAFHRLGLYVDMKLSLDSPADNEREFLPGTTAAEMEEQHPLHIYRVSQDSYLSYNAAVMRAVTDELIVYVGGGMVDRTRYLKYYDEEEQFGNFGFYWVEDPPASSTGLNLMAGAMLRLGRHLRLQFGGETRPTGFTVGGAVNFPGH